MSYEKKDDLINEIDKLLRDLNTEGYAGIVPDGSGGAFSIKFKDSKSLSNFLVSFEDVAKESNISLSIDLAKCANGDFAFTILSAHPANPKSPKLFYEWLQKQPVANNNVEEKSTCTIC